MINEKYILCIITNLPHHLDNSHILIVKNILQFWKIKKFNIKKDSWTGIVVEW
jgi:hypothetical protein